MLVKHQNLVDVKSFLNVDSTQTLVDAYRRRHWANCLCVDRIQLEFENFVKIRVQFLKIRHVQRIESTFFFFFFFLPR